MYIHVRSHENETEKPVLGFPMNNIFADIPATLPEELVETLKAMLGVRIERMVSQGHASPAGFWYDQETSEFVVLLQGAVRL